VRDALSLTDQAIAFGQGSLDDATVNAMLGLIDAADLISLITDIYNHDKSAVAAHIEQMRAQMVDATSMFDGLAELLHQLALTQLLPEVALNVNEAQAKDICTLAQHISPDVLQLYYEIVVQAREGVKLASTPMQALEMCILRLLAFRPLPVDEVLNNTYDGEVSATSTPVIESTDSPSSSEKTSLTVTTHGASEPLQSYEIDDQAQRYDEQQSSTHDNENFRSEYISDQEYNLVQSAVSTEPEPVVEPDANNSQLLLPSDEDPRSLLRCAPQELTGEWSSEKWDYWLQTAREAEVLAQDELALARQGTMTGQCNGNATFLTSVDSKHLQVTFQQLAAKLQQQFTQAQIDLKIDNSIMQSDDKTPERRQQKRLEQAKTVAETKLLNTPVMQYLTERGEGKMGKVQLY